MTKKDTSRIPLMLDLLEQHWVKHPDLRFGQLIENIVGKDIYFISDLKSIELLENYGEMGNE